MHLHYELSFTRTIIGVNQVVVIKGRPRVLAPSTGSHGCCSLQALAEARRDVSKKINLWIAQQERYLEWRSCSCLCRIANQWCALGKQGRWSSLRYHSYHVYRKTKGGPSSSACLRGSVLVSSLARFSHCIQPAHWFAVAVSSLGTESKRPNIIRN